MELRVEPAAQEVAVMLAHRLKLELQILAEVEVETQVIAEQAAQAVQVS